MKIHSTCQNPRANRNRFLRQVGNDSVQSNAASPAQAAWRTDNKVRPAILVLLLLSSIMSTSCKSLKQAPEAIQPPAPIYSGVVGNSAVDRSLLLPASSGYDKQSLTFSAGGQHYAYIAGTKVVLDAVPGQPFSRCSGAEFSPDGRLFFWAVREGKIVLSAAGQTIPTSLVNQGSLVFAKDGDHWAAYGAASESQIVVYEDGKEVGHYSDISAPAFSENGNHMAFLAAENGRTELIVDGKATVSFDPPKVKSSMMLRSFLYGPNMSMLTAVHYGGTTSLLLTQDANGWTFFKDGQPMASYLGNVWGGGDYRLIGFGGFEEASSTLAYSFVAAEDGPVAAWWERPSGKGAQWRVAINGKPADAMSFPNFWSSSRPVLSRDGKHLAYAADSAAGDSKNATVWVIWDGKKLGPYKNVWGIRLTTDGAHLAYAASDESSKADWAYYLDGKPFGGRYESVYPPAFSSSGRHVAWRAEREKKQILVIDGQEIATVNDVIWGPEVADSGASAWAVLDGSDVVKIATKIK
jgi:hypothetical protein